MHQRNEKTNKENKKRMDAHEETLRTLVVQLRHLTRNIYQKSQEVTMSSVKANHKDNEPCCVITIRSGKQLGVQDNEGLMESK